VRAELKFGSNFFESVVIAGKIHFLLLIALLRNCFLFITGISAAFSVVPRSASSVFALCETIKFSYCFSLTLQYFENVYSSDGLYKALNMHGQFSVLDIAGIQCKLFAKPFMFGGPRVNMTLKNMRCS
jgi:hypothetical protein